MYARRKSLEISVSEAKEGRFCDVDNIVEGQPNIETLAKIAMFLNVGVEELFNKKLMESF